MTLPAAGESDTLAAIVVSTVVCLLLFALFPVVAVALGKYTVWLWHTL